MFTRARRHPWSVCGAVAGALVAFATTPRQASAAPPIADPNHLLTAHERDTLENAQSGSPLSIVLVARLARHDTIADLARRTFAEEGLGAPGPPRVLLAVAAHERRAAIETGQGPAGIVPEIDARGIVARLEAELRHGSPAPALSHAIAAIAASARATAERRRPSPPDPLELRPPADQVAPPDVIEPAQGAKEAPTPGEAARPEGAKPADKRGRSLMPGAYLLAAVVILGLALRRRRRLAEDRAEQARRPPPERQRDRDVKSVGDRPMS